MAEQLEQAEKQFVVFRLGGESYGVDIGKVKEIINMQTITAVPNTASFIEGIINLRGQVIPVFNLRSKFGLPDCESDRQTRIIVVEVGDAAIGVIVDGVSEVLNVSGDIVEPPSPAISTNINEDYIAGIAKI
ncbi:MAG: chemotaxis protein CheW, partial [Bacillota bacterium]